MKNKIVIIILSALLVISLTLTSVLIYVSIQLDETVDFYKNVGSLKECDETNELIEKIYNAISEKYNIDILSIHTVRSYVGAYDYSGYTNIEYFDLDDLSSTDERYNECILLSCVGLDGSTNTYYIFSIEIFDGTIRCWYCGSYKNETSYSEFIID